MILTGRVGMEDPSNEDEEEDTGNVGRSRELEEAKVLSMGTDDASDKKKKKARGCLFPCLVTRGARYTSIAAPQGPDHNGNHVSEFQINNIIRIYKILDEEY